MTLEQKEKAFTKIIQEAAARQGCFFIEDSGEGRDLELADIYLEDVSGWLVPVNTPEGKTKDPEFFCFAEWALHDDEIIVNFVKYN